MGIQDMSFYLFNNLWLSRILAESFNEFGGIGPSGALALFRRTVLGLKLGSREQAP